MELTPEHLRVVDDTATTYETWREAQRALRKLGAPPAWRTIQGVDYLYERLQGQWGQSLGRRSATTESLHDNYVAVSAPHHETTSLTAARLDLLARQYRSLRLPRVHPMIGKICREFDLRGMLGPAVMIVGTNTMPVYEIEAQHRFVTGSLAVTQDCDFAFALKDTFAIASPRPFYAALKAVDDKFRISMERDFQATAGDGYMIEMVMAPSMAKAYPANEALRAAVLPGQEHLLRGDQVRHVLFDMNNRPVPLVVPDPRWMALHKLWLADQPGRESTKRAKDEAQGNLLAQEVAKRMRGFPINQSFRAEVPDELRRYLARFPQAVRPPGISPP